MTTGDDLRRIGTGRGSSSEGEHSRPILEAERRRILTAEDWSGSARGGHTLDRVHHLRAIVLSLAGGFLGFVLGMFASMQFHEAPLAALYPFLAGALGWAFAYGMIQVVMGGSSGLFSRVYMGGRSGTRREYSLAESFAARGRYEDAISAFELAVAEHPDDPVPYLRIARISRDHLDDVDRAVRWFRRARDESRIGPERWRIVTRELIELYDRAGQPTRAAPELARLADLHPDTREGEWARSELAEVKKLIAEERAGPAGASDPPGP